MLFIWGAWKDSHGIEEIQCSYFLNAYAFLMLSIHGKLIISGLNDIYFSFVVAPQIILSYFISWIAFYRGMLKLSSK